MRGIDRHQNATRQRPDSHGPTRPRQRIGRRLLPQPLSGARLVAPWAVTLRLFSPLFPSLGRSRALSDHPLYGSATTTPFEGSLLAVDRLACAGPPEAHARPIQLEVIPC